MKKHFLLFAVMSMLPFAAWAASADLLTKPSLATGLIYSGSPLNLTKGSYELPADYDLAVGGVLWAVTSTDAAPTSGGELNATATNAGKYYIWYKVTADGDAYQDDGAWTKLTNGGSFVRVSQATLTITAVAKEKTYGEADPELTYTQSGLLGEDAISGALTRADGTNVGTYAINLGSLTAGDNYKITYVGANLTINKKALTITAKDHAITYGAAPANNGVTYDGFIEGESSANLGGTLAYAYTYTQYDNVGNEYKITPSGLTSGNYDITFVEGTLTVNQKEVGLTWTDTSLTYNGLDQKPTATATSLENSDVVTVTVSGEKKDAGNYTATASALAGDKADNYKLPEANTQAYTIARAAVTVAADAQSKTYGDDDPTLTTSVTGMQNGEATSLIQYTISRAAGEDVNTYAITPAGDAEQGNYSVTFTPASLTITKATATVTAEAKTKVYGAADPTLTATVTGLKRDDAANVISYTISRAAGDAVGTYTITPTGDATQGNYDVTYVTADFTISKAMLTITADAKSKVYGESDPSWSVTITGYQGSDNVEVISGLAIGRTAGENVGEYTITPSSATATNYDVAFVTGKLAITPAAITLKAKDQVINQGNSIDTGADQVVVTAGALKNGDELSNFTLNLTTDKTAVGVWTDAITLTATNGNYTITTQPGKLTITAAAEIEFTSTDADLQLIEDYAGQTVPVKMKFGPRNTQSLGGTTRVWAAEQWNTLVLPFDISVADLSKVLGYAIVNVVDPTGATEDANGKPTYKFKLTMKGGNGKTDVLAANKPFVIKTAEAINPETSYEFGTQHIIAPTAEDLAGVNAGLGDTFKGTYTTKHIDKNDNEAYWFLLGNHTKWAYITKTSTASWDIIPFAGYIDQSNRPEGARGATFIMEEIDGTTTTIRGVEADRQTMAAEGWYSLSGVKLQGAPTEKGIYIRNGKKVVIK